MKRLIKPLFWTVLFLVMMLAIDQLLVQVPPLHPAHAAVSRFYRDFRGRLIDLAFGEKKKPAAEPKTIEAVLDGRSAQPSPAKAAGKTGSVEKPAAAAAPASAPPPVKTPRRYVYSDAAGELQFADSLEEVPRQFRSQAQPMGE